MSTPASEINSEEIDNLLDGSLDKSSSPQEDPSEEENKMEKAGSEAEEAEIQKPAKIAKKKKKEDVGSSERPRKGKKGKKTTSKDPSPENTSKTGEETRKRKKPGKKQKKEPEEEKKLTKPKTKTKKVQPSSPDSPSSSKQVILEYMLKQNRPYSIQNIFDNLLQTIKKPVLQKLVEELVQEKEIVVKEYGKSCIYLVNQDKINVTSEEELKEIDEENKHTAQTIADLKEKVKEIQKELKDKSKELSNEELKSQITKYEEENVVAAKDLEKFKTNSSEMISDDKMRSAEKELKHLQVEWKKRKKGLIDIVDTISEGMEISRNNFMEMVGIEQDQEICPI